MAGNIPQPRSYQRLFADMADSFLSNCGLRGLKVGGPIERVLATAAQSDVRGAQDIFNLLDVGSLDRATGIALDNIAADEGLTRLPSLSSSGTVTLSDSSFAKIVSKVYPGASAPNAGTLSLKVSDASSFPFTGQIYIGRETTNYEGPISYSAKAQVGGYWVITLATATQKFHDVNESVLLAQGGNRAIPAGTVLRTASSAESVSFSTISVATILDGETEVTGVDVLCQQPGVIGNVPKDAINSFVSEPFAGASATNPLPFNNGQPAEDDAGLRERIRNVRKSRALATALALITNAKGVRAPDENKTVISASVSTPQGEPTTLYIDDGTGYEETTNGVAAETLIDRALGGEYHAKLTGGLPIAKAFAETTLTAPFMLSPGAKLAVKVAGVLSEHSFSSGEFRAIGNATAYEVVAAINGDPNLSFSARTSSNGTRIVIFARADSNEDLEVVVPNDGSDANTHLGFPTGTNYTLRLYKDDLLLYKDGKSAIVLTSPQTQWQQTIGSGVYFKIRVDGTRAVTYKVVDQDFIDASTGYVTVSALNSLESWAKVLNYKVAGITATAISGRLQLVSNRDASAAASIVITEPMVGDLDENGVTLDGTTGKDPNFNLIKQGMFQAGVGLAAYGKNNDYTLNRNTGELKLAQPLSVGQTLTAGTAQTRAYLQSGEFSSAAVTLNESRLWISVDATASLIPTGVNASISFTITSTGGRIRYTASPSGTYFQNLSINDWVVIYDPAFKVHGAFRVCGVSSNYFEIERPAVGLQSGIFPTGGGMVFVRSETPIQLVVVTPGTNRSLTSIVAEINAQLVGATASVFRNKYLRLTTNNYGEDGTIFMAAFDVDAQALKFTRGKLATNSSNHLASITSGNGEIGTPGFDLYAVDSFHGTSLDSDLPLSIADMLAWTRRQNGTGRRAGLGLPVRNVSGTVTPRLNVRSASVLAGLLARSGGVVTASAANTFKVGDVVFVKNVSTLDANFPAGFKAISNADPTHFSYVEAGTSTTSVQAYSVVEDWGAMDGDWIYAAAPFSIGSEDGLNVVLDGNVISKSYGINMFRRVKPVQGSTYASTNVQVLDVDNSNQPLSVAFGTTDPDFFRDFWLFAKARGKSHAASGGSAPTHYHYNKALLWRFARYGAEGNKARMAYVNPTGPNQGLAVTTINGQYSDIQIRLPSDTARTSTNISENTQFTVSVSTGSPASTITYTYSKPSVSLSRATNVVTGTTGSNHGFIVGDVVFISGSTNATDLPNGAKIVATVPTATTFTYSEPGANATATATVAATATDPNLASVVVGDIVGVASGSNFNSLNKGAFQVTAKTGTSFTVKKLNGVHAVESTPVKVGVAAGIQFYPIKSTESTATKIAQYVNTNAADIVSAVAIENGGGSPGSGSITVSTLEEYLFGYQNASGPTSVQAWVLTDGVNYVDSSSLGSVPNLLNFKSGVSSDLTTNADYNAEEWRLVPVTTQALARYLSSSAVSGFYAGSKLEAVQEGKRLQVTSTTSGSSGSVHIVGGTANAASAAVVGVGAEVDTSYSKATISLAQSRGFNAGHNVAVQCDSSQKKTVTIGGGATIAISPNTTSGRWNVTLAGPNLQDSLVEIVKALPDDSTTWIIRKHGRFMSYTLIDPSSQSISTSKEGDWVVISLEGATPANTGTFRIVRTSNNGLVESFWIENPNGVEESVDMTDNDGVGFFGSETVLPGDQLIIDTDAFGIQNRGSFPIVEATNSALVVVGDMSTLSTTAVGSNAEFIRFMEAEPVRLIKKIHTINRSSNAGYVDVVFTTKWLANKMSSSAGATLLSLDKLAFENTLMTGADAYAYSTGLIGEVNKVIYGDPTNPSVYPGVVAAGAHVNISGPLTKRIQVGLVARITKGDTKSVIDRIKSAVASIINQTPQGKPVSISALIAAAEAVEGVYSVAVLSPAYGPGEDLISVQANEKPRVLDVDQDILVSIEG
jgi:hypothetical protein